MNYLNDYILVCSEMTKMYDNRDYSAQPPILFYFYRVTRERERDSNVPIWVRRVDTAIAIHKINIFKYVF